MGNLLQLLGFCGTNPLAHGSLNRHTLLVEASTRVALSKPVGLGGAMVEGVDVVREERGTVMTDFGAKAGSIWGNSPSACSFGPLLCLCCEL